MNRKLHNTPEDRLYLSELIADGKLPLATFEIGVFTSILADGFKVITHFGKVTSIDLEDGYCEWRSAGNDMPCININVITLINP